MKIRKFDVPGNLNGAFRVSHLGVKLDFAGGPYREVRDFKLYTRTVYRIKAASEQQGEADISMVVEDFGVPSKETLLEVADTAIEMALRGYVVTVGCGAGWGRTGTVLAAVLQRLGFKNPVFTLRDVYVQQAVETKEQFELINSLPRMNPII